jgi:hypothetical protein
MIAADRHIRTLSPALSRARARGTIASLRDVCLEAAP